MTYEDFISEWRSGRDYCVVHTSGSTGTPKMLRLSKTLMRNSARRTLAFFGIKRGDVIHSCISPDYIGGKMMAVRSEIGRLKLSWESPTNRPSVIRIFDGQEVPALIALVPSQMLHLIEEGIPEAFRNTVWLIGGSAIDMRLRKLIADADINAWESYGMTETASHIALRRVTVPPIPFTPMNGVEINKDDRDCLTIKVDGLNITTNDIVKLYPDNSFEILGRADNVIVTGGCKVQPEEVERILSHHLEPFGISGLMLTSEPDLKWGEKLILLVEDGRWLDVHSNIDRSTLEASILEMAKGHLKSCEIPKGIRIVKALPRTQNGKLKRK